MKKFYFMFIYLVLGCSVIFSQQPWFIENSGTTEDLNQVLYSNAKLIGIGDNGTYISSTNSGESWVSFNTGFNYNFNFFVTMSNYTFIACDGGNIIRSTNSGISWIQLNTGINSNINSIAFSSPRLFAACENGAILLSTNNGSNWIMNYNAGSALNSISFYANIVFAGGDNGIIYRSANQGNNWSQLSTGTGSNINFITQRILFADSSFYYVCGENGLLLKTSNMGLNWITINTGYNYNFTSVSRLNNNIFLSSTEGKILLSTNTGYTWSIDYNGSVPLNHFNITINRGVGNNGLILYRYPNDHLKNYRMIDANSISTFYTNFSQFNNDFHNFKSGFEWPKGENKYARYASGIWIGAVVENDTLVAITEYNDYEFYPGFTDNTGIPLGKLDSNFKVYKIAGDINSNDRNKWPNVLLGNSDQGAPVFFDSLSGIWKPLDFGAQTLFTSYTDSYLESHSNYIGNTLPLKADIKLLSYSFIYP